MSTPDAAPANTADLAELRAHLFATLRALRDKTEPMPTDRARAISEVAKTVIDTARVELEAAAMAKATPASGFIAIGHAAPAPAPGTPPVPNGIRSITQHYLADDDEGATTTATRGKK